MKEMPELEMSALAMKAFKEKFCEHFKCAPESFLWELLKRSLYPRARPFAPIIYLFKPPEMFTLLQNTGDAKEEADLREAIADYEFSTSFFRRSWTRRFKMRVSC